MLSISSLGWLISHLMASFAGQKCFHFKKVFVNYCSYFCANRVLFRKSLLVSTCWQIYTMFSHYFWFNFDLISEIKVVWLAYFLVSIVLNSFSYNFTWYAVSVCSKGSSFLEASQTWLLFLIQSAGLFSYWWIGTIDIQSY